MFEPSLTEKIVHKANEKTRRVFGKLRRNKLISTDFTIISNNCWGGIVYEYYGLPKLSPTVGLYFFADEYIRFISDIKYYTDKEIEFITVNESKYKNELKKRKEDVPIGVLEDVEIVFLHYSDVDQAREKWNRRIRRINYSNLIAKFSQMNCCKEEHMIIFDNLPIDKKFMFTKDRNNGYECGVYYPGFEKDEEISNDTFYWNRYFDITQFLNGNGIVKTV